MIVICTCYNGRIRDSNLFFPALCFHFQMKLYHLFNLVQCKKTTKTYPSIIPKRPSIERRISHPNNKHLCAVENKKNSKRCLSPKWGKPNNIYIQTWVILPIAYHPHGERSPSSGSHMKGKSSKSSGYSWGSSYSRAMQLNMTFMVFHIRASRLSREHPLLFSA